MLGRDAARRYAQDSAVLSSPRCFSAQISRNAIGWSLPICGLSEVKQVINSGHRRALVNLMHQLYPCLRSVLFHVALLSADANRKAQNAVRSTLYCCMALSPEPGHVSLDKSWSSYGFGQAICCMLATAAANPAMRSNRNPRHQQGLMPTTITSCKSQIHQLLLSNRRCL